MNIPLPIKDFTDVTLAMGVVDMEVDKVAGEVADMKVVKVADMELDMVVDFTDMTTSGHPGGMKVSQLLNNIIQKQCLDWQR